MAGVRQKKIIECAIWNGPQHRELIRCKIIFKENFGYSD